MNTTLAVTIIAGIDVGQLCRDILTGAIGSHAMTAVESPEGAIRVACELMAARIKRPLADVERLDVSMQAELEWWRRRRRIKAQARETAERLHNPMFGIRGIA